MEITKQSTDELLRAVTAYFKALAQEKGLKLTGLRAGYDPRAGDVRFTVKLAADTVGGVPKEEADFLAQCDIWGLKPEHYKAMLFLNGDNYLLVGFLSGTKYSILAQRVRDGKRFKFTSKVVDHLSRFKKDKDLETMPMDQLRQRAIDEAKKAGRG